jgi:hypothetical protein
MRLTGPKQRREATLLRAAENLVLGVIGWVCLWGWSHYEVYSTQQCSELMKLLDPPCDISMFKLETT